MNNSKERHGCVNAWLWIAIIANLGYGIFYAVSMFGEYMSSSSLGFGFLSILSAINLLGSILLMRWNKCGFYLFIISAILSAIVNVGLLKLEPYMAIFGLIAIILWWAILQIKKDGISAWNNLETGWDYKHCRHLYQMFAIVIGILLVLTIFAYSRDLEDNSTDDDFSIDDSELFVDSVAIDENDDILWETFSDAANSCEIEAPNDFRKAELSEDQILGLMCSDYDPAIVIVRETVSSLKSASITTLKDYTGVIVKMNRHIDGASNFKKISEEEYGENSYLVVYNLTLDGDEFRYNLLASKNEKYFYYCQVFCLAEYTEKLQPTMSHMLSSFKIMK